MEPNLKDIQRTSRNIFLGSFLLIAFFIFAVKFNILQSRQMAGEQLPEIKSNQWLTLPLSMNDIGGKVVLLFFIKNDVEISREMLAWSEKLLGKYQSRGLIAIAITIPVENGSVSEYTPFDFSHSPAGLYAFADTGNIERKKYRHASYATFYVTDRLGVIRDIGDASKGFESVENSIAEQMK